MVPGLSAATLVINMYGISIYKVIMSIKKSGNPIITNMRGFFSGSGGTLLEN